MSGVYLHTWCFMNTIFGGDCAGSSAATANAAQKGSGMGMSKRCHSEWLDCCCHVVRRIDVKTVGEKRKTCTAGFQAAKEKYEGNAPAGTGASRYNPRRAGYTPDSAGENALPQAKPISSLRKCEHSTPGGYGGGGNYIPVVSKRHLYSPNHA